MSKIPWGRVGLVILIVLAAIDVWWIVSAWVALQSS